MLFLICKNTLFDLQKSSLKNAAVIEFKPSTPLINGKQLCFKKIKTFKVLSLHKCGAEGNLIFWNLKIKTKKLHRSSYTFAEEWIILLSLYIFQNNTAISVL